MVDMKKDWRQTIKDLFANLDGEVLKEVKDNWPDIVEDFKKIADGMNAGLTPDRLIEKEMDTETLMRASKAFFKLSQKQLKTLEVYEEVVQAILKILINQIILRLCV